MWTIDIEYITSWLDDQDDETVALIFTALEVLQQEGPSLGRPLVDTIKGSRVKNMKELARFERQLRGAHTVCV